MARVPLMVTLFPVVGAMRPLPPKTLIELLVIVPVPVPEPDELLIQSVPEVTVVAPE